MGLFGKSKKEREKEYMNKLDVPSCLKENFVLDLFHYFKYSVHYSLDKYTFDI